MRFTGARTSPVVVLTLVLALTLALAFAQATGSELLMTVNAGTGTAEEAAELERFGEIEHLMQLIKARAHLYAEQPA